MPFYREVKNKKKNLYLLLYELPGQSSSEHKQTRVMRISYNDIDEHFTAQLLIIAPAVYTHVYIHYQVWLPGNRVYRNWTISFNEFGISLRLQFVGSGIEMKSETDGRQ